MSNKSIELAVSLIFLGTIVVGYRGCNNLMNNRTLKSPTKVTHSFATGINGHVEFTQYKNGSSSIKKYHGLGHAYLDSELLDDFDGDGKINRIRSNHGDIFYNRQSELLDRETDFEEYCFRFEEADAYLAELKNLYPVEK